MLTHWKRLWCWEGLGAGGEGDNRGWDGWMASLTRWTWVWVNSGSWWWTGRPGVLRFMGSQRVGHDWATDLIRIMWNCLSYTLPCICVSLSCYNLSLGILSSYKGIFEYQQLFKLMFLGGDKHWNFLFQNLDNSAPLIWGFNRANTPCLGQKEIT